jgi:hypothetical protein
MCVACFHRFVWVYMDLAQEIINPSNKSWKVILFYLLSRNIKKKLRNRIFIL